MHVWLWWKWRLGKEFPVVDNMLQKPVWSQLNSICDNGIRNRDAHVKV